MKKLLYILFVWLLPVSVFAAGITVYGGSRMFTTELNGVTPSYTGMTASGIHQEVLKGQANEYVLRPQILNEHSVRHADIVDEVDATTIVGQIFKASKDNINSITIPMASAERIVHDTFESYADSAALQVVWVEGTNAAVLETTIVATGGSTKSMKLPLTTTGDAWTKTFAATNFTGYNGTFEIYQTVDHTKATIAIELEDSSGNFKSLDLVINDANQWISFDIPEDALVEDSGNAADTDMTDIIISRFKVISKEIGALTYIDNYYATPYPGSIEIKLWDFGSTIPAGGVDDLDSATQYTEIGDRGFETVASSYTMSLIGGQRNYHIDNFTAGVAKDESGNTLLTIDNYYAITFHYVDTDVNIYGNGSSSYDNGFAFYAPDTSTAITDLSKDIGFGIFSTQDIYIQRILWVLHNSSHGVAAPGGNTHISLVITDTDRKILPNGTILAHIIAPGSMDRNLSVLPYFIEDGGRLTLYYEDDYTDNVVDLILNQQYKFIPGTPNG